MVWAVQLQAGPGSSFCLTCVAKTPFPLPPPASSRTSTPRPQVNCKFGEACKAVGVPCDRQQWQALWRQRWRRQRRQRM